MSEEPRERSEVNFLGHTEPSMTQNEPQETPRKSSFLSYTETQETSPLSGGILRDGFGHGLDDGDVASMLDKQRYGTITMIDTPRYVRNNTYDENDKRQPYMGTAASYDSRGFLIDSVTSFSSSTGSSQQLHASGQGYGTTNNSDLLGHQTNISIAPGGHIPSMSRNYYTASGQGYGTTNYSDLFGHQTNISIAPGGHIPLMSRNYYRASGQGYGTTNNSDLLGHQTNISIARGGHTPSMSRNYYTASGQGYGTTNNSNLFGHQTNISIAPGGHIPSMSRNYYTASGQGYDTISYNTFGSQSIPSMITQRNSSLITSMGSQRNSGRVLGDSGALFTGSTASSQHNYYDFETPRMQANFGGNNIASTNNYNRQSYYGRGLLGDSGAGYGTNNYNPFMTSQRYNGALHVDSASDEEDDTSSNSDSSMSPPRTPTPPNSEKKSNIGQSHKMQNNGNLYGASTTPVGTRTTNTVSSPSHQEPRQWTITKQLTINDVNCSKEWVRLPSHDVERHIKPNISDFDNRARGRYGISVMVYDHDKSTSYGMNLIYRDSCGYCLLGKWGINFVERRGLREGGTIGLEWDTCKSRLQFSVLSCETAQEKDKLSYFLA